VAHIVFDEGRRAHGAADVVRGYAAMCVPVAERAPLISVVAVHVYSLVLWVDKGWFYLGVDYRVYERLGFSGSQGCLHASS